MGIKVIRFTNEQVLNNQDLVLAQMKDYIADLSSPLPWERGTGGDEAEKLGGQEEAR